MSAMKPVKHITPVNPEYNDDSDFIVEVEVDENYYLYALSEEEKNKLTANYINNKKNRPLDFERNRGDDNNNDRIGNTAQKNYHIKYMRKFEILKVIDEAKMKLIIMRYKEAKQLDDELIKHFQLVTNERNDWMNLVYSYSSSTSYIVDMLETVDNEWLWEFKRQLIMDDCLDLMKICSEMNNY